MKTVLKYVKNYKKDSVLTVVFTALEVIMEVLLPFVMSYIIDYGIQAGDINNVYIFGAVMIVMAGLSLTFGAYSGRYVARASSGFAANLRKGIYDKVQTFSFANIDRFSTASLVTRMTTDVTNIQNAYMMTLRIATRAPLTLIFSWLMCFFINKEISLIFFAAIILLGCVLAVIIKLSLKYFDKAFNTYDRVNADIQENISAIRVVKSYVREDHEIEKFDKVVKLLKKFNIKAEGYLTLNSPALMLCVYGCTIAISWFAAHYIIADDMTTGNLTTLLSYIMQILMSLMMLSMIFVMIAMSSASVHRISQVLNEVPDIHNPENPVEEVKDGSIDFTHVDFSYRKNSDKNALSDIDIHIRSGETIGIIGGTGSGKSSFVNLICRLYDVSAGSVCVGGTDVREYDTEALRNSVSVVLQKNVLFSGTILENLRWGNPDATEEECIAACKAACADEFIARMPDKYNTYIERGGTNVSGGQKQRLCIARALLKKPKVLILDDSTSAVDTATDAKIRKAFATAIPDTTKIIIAQRVSSVKDADRIIVLDEGRVNGFDTHENLLKNNAIYSEIFESQQGGGDFDQQ
ncbi:MAG TPA: ABC transporter ATP-binding protein/permease [Candidatus Eubacterium faecipullorum]|uniref:ABC transporter ATP-binding protein/permease n=1 Tax=Candidatus Eubacterium faecipullorum TaxID=2838571 RepID=A0A9D1RF47_9FIRM|nr:ABC transporter ATP-binding protein/permease [Candidatus Eubacterium faecipullorum]